QHLYEIRAPEHSSLYCIPELVNHDQGEYRNKAERYKCRVKAQKACYRSCQHRSKQHIKDCLAHFATSQYRYSLPKDTSEPSILANSLIDIAVNMRLNVGRKNISTTSSATMFASSSKSASALPTKPSRVPVMELR